MRTVLPAPSRRMFWRKSRIWFGSRPAVGSSMMSTSGSWSSACATPTRWRKPRESFPMGFSITSSSAERAATSLMREVSRPGGISRASPKKRSSSAGVMSG